MRIQLKRLEHKHLFKLTSILDQETARLSNIAWPFDKKIAENFIINYNTWGIWINGDLLVGAIEVKDSLETAYFVHPQWRNQGVASEALIQCKEIFGPRQLWCVINPDNQASLKVANKAQVRVQFFNGTE